MHKAYTTILLSALAVMMFSCSPKNITTKYYGQNKKLLDTIEETFKKTSLQHPYALVFTSKRFKTVSLEIITDSLSYIYEFGVNEARLTDTLVKYHLDAPQVIRLIKVMQGIRCTWIKNFDYYVDEKKNSLIFISIKPVGHKRQRIGYR